MIHLGPVDCWRLIPTRVPSADLFHGITDFGEWDAINELEQIFNQRSLGPLGNLAAVPAAHRAYGPGSAYLMAPFAYPTPGRFGDGTYGVLYSAMEEATALTEVAFHRAAFMRQASMPNENLDFQLLGLVFDGDVEDIRGANLPAVYDPDSWASGQILGAQVRGAGTDGVAYSSVRRLGGQCVAGFRPNAQHSCRTLRYPQFFWDGTHQLLYGAGFPPC